MREHDVLREFLKGKQNKAIAIDLKIYPYTVAKHIKSIFRKLDVHSRAEAIQVTHISNEGQLFVR